MDEAVRRLNGENPRPFACFTFDDGYADNLTRVLPIMERFNAPFTVFVTTGMITREIDAWWFGLAALVRSHDRIELAVPRLRFECPDGDSTFSLELVSEVPASEEMTIYFECEDLDAECARIDASGIRFEHPPIDMPWLRVPSTRPPAT